MSDPETIERPTDPASWRGKLTPDAAAAARQNDGDDTARGHVRLRKDARILLGDLLRPHRRAIAWVLAAALLQVSATMAAPWLIGVGIDHSLPDARRGDYTSLITVGVSLVLAALVSGWLRSEFVLRSGIIGQAVL